jgi:hypothetical protein
MKVEAIRFIQGKENDHPPGTVFETDDKEAEWLIKNDFAKKADGKPPAPPPPRPRPETGDNA